MNTYTTLPDGSMVYNKPIPINTINWKVDPENPCRLIPNVPACTSRRIELRTLSCGLKRATWHCDFDKCRADLKMCKGCDHAQSEQSPNTPVQH